MRWFLFEDSSVEQLYPIALARPVFELICGREGLRRRVQRWFPSAEWGAVIRPWLADVYREEQPSAIVNQFDGIGSSSVLMINGRWIPDRRLTIADVTMENVGLVDGQIAWIALEPEEASLLDSLDFEQVLQGIARSRRVVEASGTMMNRPWDLITRNPRQLELDFADEGVSQHLSADQVKYLGDPSDIYVSEQTEIDPYVVIDARQGPVSIDRDVQIQSFSKIEGPCHVSRGARIFRGVVRGGTTIGAWCRVGGEIEQSVLHSYVNKYHEGFLGHSYICPWVNLGAMTTTSDLRCDYKNVEVPLQGDLIDSDTIKIGSFIGDHSKTAIDSMFNTGSSVGAMTVVVPGGRLLPRHIPSFCNVSFGNLAMDWPLDTAIQTVRAAMQRRDCELTAAGENLLRKLYELTAEERIAAVNLAAENKTVRPQG
ncbi:putative sugar nucleotidyl transferase [Fuerstiella marisgermanici]|nr:putative sugar nucleotidyl transferase [Fuerstiella marisgermanici]